MSDAPGLDSTCPTCGKPVGDHTIRDYGDCVAGLNYHLPYEDTGDNPIRFGGIDGDVVGEVTVAAAVIEAPTGRHPALRFNFVGPGPEPMSRRSLPPITLVLDANGMRTVRQLISTAIDKAITAARRGH